MNQRESLKQRKVTTGLRLERASVLITALSGEKVCQLILICVNEIRPVKAIFLRLNVFITLPLILVLLDRFRYVFKPILNQIK